MTDGNPRYQELQSGPRATGGLRVFQFSLLSVFVIMTAMALILSAFFAVGRLVGMSTMEVLTRGFGQSFFTLPTLLVWSVGLTMAIRRLKRYRLPATLTIIALTGLALTSFVLQVTQMALIHLVSVGKITSNTISWSFTLIRVVYAVLNTAWWILILVAIFVRRPPDALETERANPSGNPFSTNEPNTP